MPMEREYLELDSIVPRDHENSSATSAVGPEADILHIAQGRLGIVSRDGRLARSSLDSDASEGPVAQDIRQLMRKSRKAYQLAIPASLAMSSKERSRAAWS